MDVDPIGPLPKSIDGDLYVQIVYAINDVEHLTGWLDTEAIPNKYPRIILEFHLEVM